MIDRSFPWVFLVLILSLTLCSAERVEAGEWKPVEQSIVTGLLVADWAQTRDIAKRDDILEAWNVYLGERPSVGKVNVYFAATIVVYNTAAYLLPPDWARALSIGVGAIEVSAIGNNLMLGVKFNFK